jgi:hypothetical protein
MEDYCARRRNLQMSDSNQHTPLQISLYGFLQGRLQAFINATKIIWKTLRQGLVVRILEDR